MRQYTRAALDGPTASLRPAERQRSALGASDE
jgi:hypothetical protein